MAAIREHGQINENTFLIDSYLFGVAGIGAVYLVQAGKTCLIDTGSPKEGARIKKTLKKLGAFPPDYIIITHSHWDHSQGITYLRQKAGKERDKIKVFAGEKAISLLADQSFNKAFHPDKTYKNIAGVTPLKDGDTLDLDGLTLKIFNAPGHTPDHIAVLDEKNKNLFLGDSMGVHLGPKSSIGPFMPPFFNKETFLDTVKKLRKVDFKQVSMGHFGVLDGADAENFLDRAQKVFADYWRLFEEFQREGKLEDRKYMASTAIKKLDLVVPDFKIKDFKMKIILGLVNLTRRITGKEIVTPGKILLPEIMNWLSQGYQDYHKANT